MTTTTIQVDTTVRDQIASLGGKGDTYNEILKRILAKAAYVEFMEQQYKILDEETEWTSLDEVA